MMADQSTKQYLLQLGPALCQQQDVLIEQLPLLGQVEILDDCIAADFRCCDVLP